MSESQAMPPQESSESETSEHQASVESGNQASAQAATERDADYDRPPSPTVVLRAYVATSLFAAVRGAGHLSSPTLIKQIVSETDALLAELAATAA
jgi:hypothetical protein